MGTSGDARARIKDWESGTFCTHHLTWARSYLTAAEEHAGNGRDSEALNAHWMAHLLHMATVPRPMRRDGQQGWFAPVVEFADGSRSPGPQGITDAMLAFYDQQCSSIRNPFLRCRCHDILWEKRHDHRSARASIMDHLEAVSIIRRRGKWGDEYAHIARAIELSMSIGDEAVGSRARRAWKSLIARMRVAQPNGLLVRIIDLHSLFGPSLKSPARRRMAEECAATASTCRNAGDHDAERMWLMCALPLYRHAGAGDAAIECEARIAEAYLSQGTTGVAQGSGLVAEHFLQQARESFHRLGGQYKARDTEIAGLLAEAHKKALTELRPIVGQAEVPSEFTEWVDALSTRPLREGLGAVFQDRGFVPKVADLRRYAAETESEMPLYHLFGQTILDERNIAAQSDATSHEEFLLFEHMRPEVHYRTQLLARAVWGVIGKRRATSRSFSSLVARPLIRSDARALVSAGIARYVKHDFVSALHVLIPQFESCIRYTLSVLGRPTSKLNPRQKGTSQEKTLDEMLRDEVLTSVLGEDLCYLYRYVFTDQRGWNLRNRVCHGLAGAQAFGEPFAAAVLYSILTLGRFDLAER